MLWSTESFLKNAWHWKTLLLGVAIFYILALGENLFRTVSTPMLGGCAGCLPDGKGGVACVNECPSDPNDVVILGIFMVTSYVFALAFVEWRSRIRATSLPKTLK